MLEVIIHPSAGQYPSLCKRPEIDRLMLSTGIQTVFNEIKRNGDEALLNYTEKFDGVKLQSSIYDITSKDAASIPISDDLKQSITIAYHNIKKFHLAQKSDALLVETMPGIVCKQHSLPINKVGIYIPGGSAPLFSTVLMLA
ncbi:MAG: histidinol dehydrogenase, partial [Saprospiraceae bacterium]